MGQVAHVGAAVFLGHGDAQHAEVAHLLPGIHRELVGPVDLAARGASSAWAQLRTDSRSISMSSPRSNFRPGSSVMVVSPVSSMGSMGSMRRCRLFY
jgi:hypothetical protein